MRGINHEHIWFMNQTSSFAAIKATGANTVRVVLGSGKRWGPSTDVANVITLCKQNRLICVLEVHDTTGFGEDGAAATLDEAVTYWISQKSVLVGQENYVVINIGNEPIGNNNPAQWTAATTAAIQRMRTNGFEHLLMVDAPNWGQDWQFVMRDNAATVLNADTKRNTVLSIHMYDVFNTTAAITTTWTPSAPTAGRWSSVSSAGRPTPTTWTTRSSWPRRRPAGWATSAGRGRATTTRSST
jgi:mannan endo-1,4-beta-mannosidase